MLRAQSQNASTSAGWGACGAHPLANCGREGWARQDQELSAKRLATSRKTANARYLPNDTKVPTSAAFGGSPVEVSGRITYCIAYGIAAVAAVREVVKVRVDPAAIGWLQFEN